MKALKLRSAFKCIQVIVHEYCQMVWKTCFIASLHGKALHACIAILSFRQGEHAEAPRCSSTLECAKCRAHVTG